MADLLDLVRSGCSYPVPSLGCPPLCWPRSQAGSLLVLARWQPQVSTPPVRRELLLLSDRRADAHWSHGSLGSHDLFPTRAWS